MRSSLNSYTNYQPRPPVSPPHPSSPNPPSYAQASPQGPSHHSRLNSSVSYLFLHPHPTDSKNYLPLSQTASNSRSFVPAQIVPWGSVGWEAPSSLTEQKGFATQTQASRTSGQQIDGILLECELAGSLTSTRSLQTKLSRQLVLLNSLSPQSNAFSVTCADGSEVMVGRDAVTFYWPREYLGQVYRYGVEDIARLTRMCSTLADRYEGHLKIAWGSYVDKGVTSITSQMLSAFLFGQMPKPHGSSLCSSLFLSVPLCHLVCLVFTSQRTMFHTSY